MAVYYEKHFGEIRYKNGDWIYVAEVQWRSHVNTAMNSYMEG